MTELPNPFNSGAIQASPDEAAVPFRPQVPEGTAADPSISDDRGKSTGETHWPASLSGGETNSGSTGDSELTRSARSSEACNIGEIFVGAARLEPPEIWFENSAYPREDELLFEVLDAMADRSLPGIAEIPDEAAFMIEIGPLPLFMQNAEAAA